MAQSDETGDDDPVGEERQSAVCVRDGRDEPTAGDRDSAVSLADDDDPNDGTRESAVRLMGASDASSAPDPRMVDAWCEWLGALAFDADAALAASHVYGDLLPAARDAWLDALSEDAPKLAVPMVAIYAPLLAVETDPVRCRRIEDAIGGELDDRAAKQRIRALRGIAADGARIVALVSPLYLSFVRVLWCRYVCDAGFAWVRHDAILYEKDAPAAGCTVDDVHLEPTPLTPVVEELAHAVLAERRKGTGLPYSLSLFAHVFDARIEEDDEPLL